MKRRNKGLFIAILLFLLTSFIGVARWGIKEVKVSAEEETHLVSKILYIDFLLVDQYQEKLDDPSFHYIGEEEKTVKLIELEDGVFFTEEEIPVETLIGEGRGFNIELSGYIASSWVFDGYPLLDLRYDYLYLEYSLEEGISIGGYGHFGEKEEDPGAYYWSQRVWLSRPEIDSEVGSYPFGAVWAVGYFEDGEYKVLPMTILSGGSLYYANIPYKLTSVDFILAAKREKHGYVVYTCAEVNVLQYGVCYYLVNSKESLEASTMTVIGADSNCLARVAEAYLSFGKDPSNGSDTNTISNLFKTWMKNKSATDDQLDAEKIMDYAGYADNGNSYVGLKKIVQYSVREKWDGLCANAGIDPNTGEIRTYIIFDGLTIYFIASGIIIFILLVSGMFLLIRFKK